MPVPSITAASTHRSRSHATIALRPLASASKGARLDLRLAGAGRAHTHRDGDLHLVHVKARGARVDDVQGVGHHGFTSRQLRGEGGGGRGRSDWDSHP